MSVKRVFALHGASNTGKTSTLNYLIEILRNNASSVILDQKVGTNDRRAVFILNGVKVGVSTQGDSKDQVKKNLDVIEQQHCEIIFCATRTKGETCNHVSSKYGDKLTWLQASSLYNNKRDAFDNRTLIKECNKAIANLLYKFT